jgi:hypothetical protein
MFVKTFLPVMIGGHFHPRGGSFALSDATAQYLIQAGVASPDDSYLDAMKQRARKLGQNVDWTPPGVVAGVMTESSESSFGEKLRKACQTRAAQRSGTRNQRQQPVATEDESFAGKLKRAVARRQVARR